MDNDINKPFDQYFNEDTQERKGKIIVYVNKDTNIKKEKKINIINNN